MSEDRGRVGKRRQKFVGIARNSCSFRDHAEDIVRLLRIQRQD